MTQLIGVALIGALAFWKRHTFLYLIAASVLIATGLAWYDFYKTPAGLIEAIAIFAIGLYCLFRAAVALFRR